MTGTERAEESNRTQSSANERPATTGGSSLTPGSEIATEAETVSTSGPTPEEDAETGIDTPGLGFLSAVFAFFVAIGVWYVRSR